jgi:hypothetical protein
VCIAYFAYIGLQGQSNFVHQKYLPKTHVYLQN